MKQLFKYAFGAILAFTTMACHEEISLDVKNSDKTYLVVDGFVSTDTMSYYVRLSKTTNFFSNETAPAVSGATVTIDDGVSVVTLTENAKTGYYFTPANYYGVAGRTYKLSIDVVEDGETEHYESKSYLPDNGLRLDSADYYYDDKYGKIWYFNFSGQKKSNMEDYNYYTFPLALNGDIVTSYSKWNIVDDKMIGDNYAKKLNIQYLDGEEDWYNGDYIKLKSGDVATLYVCSITKDFYDYLSALQTELSEGSPMISPPPANLPSNISNGALGFFTAFSQSSCDILITDPEKKKE